MTIRISVIAFLLAVLVSLLPYELHQLGLGTAAVILCYWIASAVSNRWAGLTIFIPSAVATTQLLVTARRMICEEGLYATLKSDESLPMYLVGDVLYGFKHLVMTMYESVAACVNYLGDETALTRIEGMNPRLFIVGWLILGFSIVLMLRRTPEIAKNPK